MTTHSLGERLVGAFRELWAHPPRRLTLARIACHRRQFENWWKFEIGTHLWELAKSLNAEVWLEADERADIVLAPARCSQIDLERELRLRIELKTMGTFWGDHKKAYADPTKKGLLADMQAVVSRAGTARPFACVGLLVTHHGPYHELSNSPFLDYPRALAETNALTPLLDEEVPVGLPMAGMLTSAHQFLWATKAT